MKLYLQKKYITFSHWENCLAPICFESIEQDGQSDVIWFLGEPLCLKNDLSAPTKYVQKVQRRINKLMLKGRFKYPDRAFTFEMLSKIKKVTVATKGLNPERPIELKRFDVSNALERTGTKVPVYSSAALKPVGGFYATN